MQTYVNPFVDSLTSGYRSDLPPGLNSFYNISSTANAALSLLSTGIQSLESAYGVQGISTAIAPMAGEAALLNATAAEGGGTTLFRVVGPDELSGIQQAGRYTGSPGGLEVKYFYPTAEQGANFAANPANAQFGPFTLTSTEVPTSVLNSSTAVNVATEGRVITIPNGQLPGLGTPTIHPSIPLPGH